MLGLLRGFSYKASTRAGQRDSRAKGFDGCLKVGIFRRIITATQITLLSLNAMSMKLDELQEVMMCGAFACVSPKLHPGAK